MIILGLNGVTGRNVQFNAEQMALKIDLDIAILPKRVDIHVHPRCNLIPKLVIMDPAQVSEKLKSDSIIEKLLIKRNITLKHSSYSLTFLS